MIHRLLNLLNRETIEAEVRLLAETRKAVKVEREGRAAWLPRAWIIRRRDLGGGRIEIKIAVRDWLRKFN